MIDRGDVFGYLTLFGAHRAAFGEAELSLAQTLARQAAVAWMNLVQRERLLELYQANIHRHEEERTSLAWELHDQVLNELAALMNDPIWSDASPRSQASYQALVGRLRQLVRGLRPAMLDYGLEPALEDLLDDLSRRSGDPNPGPSFSLELEGDGARYEPQVEGHLFRIVQQACENILRHAQARNVWIVGRLAQDEAELTVEDDGQGFDREHPLDLPRLLADKHFGLAGMHERAALIGAVLSLDSEVGQGTRVTILWKKA